jgi:hypothetical protein
MAKKADITVLRTPGGEFILKPNNDAADTYLWGHYARPCDRELGPAETLRIVKLAKASGMRVAA